MLYKKVSTKLLINIFLICSIFETSDCKTCARYNNNKESYNKEIYLRDLNYVKSTEDCAAFVVYDPRANETGWDIIEIMTAKGWDRFSDEQKAFAAGYLEGNAMQKMIWYQWKNSIENRCNEDEDICELIKEHVSENRKWINSMIEQHAKNDSYWYQVKLYLIQLDGLHEGYKAAAPESEKLSYDDIFNIQLDCDFPNLLSIYKNKQQMHETRCTALIKVLPDFSDVIVAHDTWDRYNNLLRAQKKYSLHYKESSNSFKEISGHTMSFTSSPGGLVSFDDFYITSARLIILETSIENFNSDLFSYVYRRKQLFYFIRAMIANRLSSSGRQWTDIFRKNNSGTYNNQWMILDLKRFCPKNGKNSLKPNFLWVLEELPGITEASDMTYLLREQTYWPSYNKPFFRGISIVSDISNVISEYAETEKSNEDWMTYSKTPRALIIKQRQKYIVDVPTMAQVMNYNNFKEDPYSRCNCTPPYTADAAIAGRSDLNDPNGTYPFPDMMYRLYGATDMKITNLTLSCTYRFVAQAGPLYDESLGIPPFNWESAYNPEELRHYGQPNLHKFKPIIHKWQYLPCK